MSVVNGIVEKGKPISLYEVTRLLGENSIDVGTACRSDKVKPWAKFKPQAVYSQYDTPAELTEEMRRIGDAPWGLKYPEYTSTDQLSYAAAQLSRQSLGTWYFQKPGIWARLTDFDGYDHNAGCPFPSLEEEQTVGVTINGTANIDLIRGVLSTGSLGASDFAFRDTAKTPLSQGHLGILLYFTSGLANGTVRYYTNSGTGLLLPLRIQERMQNSLTGIEKDGAMAYAALFVSTSPINSNGISTPSDLHVVLLPRTAPCKIRFVPYGSHGTGTSITIKGWVDLQENKVYFQVAFHNYETGDATFSGGTGSNVPIRVFMCPENNYQTQVAYKDIPPREDTIQYNNPVPGESTEYSDIYSFDYEKNRAPNPWLIITDCYVDHKTRLSTQTMCFREFDNNPDLVEPGTTPPGWNDW